MKNPAALLIFRIMLDLLGGNRPRARRQMFEFKLPDWQHAQSLIAQHADIEFAALNVFLCDGGRADRFMNEGDAFHELFVGVHHGGLRYSQTGILAQALDDERKTQAGWATGFAPHWKDRERG